jgi:hypothetical protein
VHVMQHIMHVLYRSNGRILRMPALDMVGDATYKRCFITTDLQTLRTAHINEVNIPHGPQKVEGTSYCICIPPWGGSSSSLHPSLSELIPSHRKKG